MMGRKATGLDRPVEAAAMRPEPWYAARSLYFHNGLRAPIDGPVYEERIVLIRAEDFSEAIRKAEDEARAYEKPGIEFLEYVMVFHLSEESIGDGVEVFSLMRTSDLGPEEYIDRFFDDGSERCQRSGDDGEGRADIRSPLDEVR